MWDKKNSMSDAEIRIPVEVVVRALESGEKLVDSGFSFLEKLTTTGAELLTPLLEAEVRVKKAHASILEAEAAAKVAAIEQD